MLGTKEEFTTKQTKTCTVTEAFYANHLS